VSVEAISAVLREGGFDLAVVVGAFYRSPTGSTEGALSPGLLETHYAPRARLILFSGEQYAAVSAIGRAVTDAIRTGERVGILVYDDDLPAISAVVPLRAGSVTVARVGASSAPEVVAHRLFAALRELDAAAVTVIVARTTTPVTYVPGAAPLPGGIGLARAIDDRLIRAAGSRVESTSA
jgi:L-threonylcarbamoyladenylate synthase